MFLHIVLFFVAFFGSFLVLIAVVKLRQVRAASRWPSVTGTIISSAASAGQVTTHHAGYEEDVDRKEERNFARITYLYTVEGKKYKCSRISVGEDMGNDDVQGKLQRYPVGRTVEVFYNPADPGKAVLERRLPEGCVKAGFMGLGLVLGIIAVFGYGLDYAVSVLTPHVKNSDQASMVIFLATFSLLCFWFTVAGWLQGWSARKWLRTMGRIETVEDPNERTIIVYSYQVEGVSYKSDVIDFGGNKHSVFKLTSGVTLRGGQPHQDVEVFYDPTDPAKCCLRASMGMSFLPLIIAVIAGFMAWWIAIR